MTRFECYIEIGRYATTAVDTKETNMVKSMFGKHMCDSMIAELLNNWIVVNPSYPANHIS